MLSKWMHNTGTNTIQNKMENRVPPLSHTYILYDYIYDGTNKTKPKEISTIFKGHHPGNSLSKARLKVTAQNNQPCES